VLEARVNVCRGESLHRLKFSFIVTYTQKEKPLDLSPNTPRHSWVVRSPQRYQEGKFEPSPEIAALAISDSPGGDPEKPQNKASSRDLGRER